MPTDAHTTAHNVPKLAHRTLESIPTLTDLQALQDASINASKQHQFYSNLSSSQLCPDPLDYQTLSMSFPDCLSFQAHPTSVPVGEVAAASTPVKRTPFSSL